MEFSRQVDWSGLPFLSPGDLPDPGLNPGLLHCRQILYHLSHQGRLLFYLITILKCKSSNAGHEDILFLCLVYKLNFGQDGGIGGRGVCRCSGVLGGGSGVVLAECLLGTRQRYLTKRKSQANTTDEHRHKASTKC